MAVNALTIVQGTMHLEVPLLEDEGKKGEYWLQIFAPGECESGSSTLPDKSRDLQQTPVAVDAYRGLLFLTKLRVIVDASLSDFN